jgi:hypothetical protein
MTLMRPSDLLVTRRSRLCPDDRTLYNDVLRRFAGNAAHG